MKRLKLIISRIGYFLVALGCEHHWNVVTRDFAYCVNCDKVLGSEDSAKMFEAAGYVEPQLYGFTRKHGLIR